MSVLGQLKWTTFMHQALRSLRTETEMPQHLEMDIFCEMLDIKAVPVRQTSKYRVWPSRLIPSLLLTVVALCRPCLWSQNFGYCSVTKIDKSPYICTMAPLYWAQHNNIHGKYNHSRGTEDGERKSKLIFHDYNEEFFFFFEASFSLIIMILRASFG